MLCDFHRGGGWLLELLEPMESLFSLHEETSEEAV